MAELDRKRLKNAFTVYLSALQIEQGKPEREEI